MSTIDVQLQSPLSADHNMISKPIGPSDRSENPHDNHEANKGNQTNLAEEVPSPSPENEPDPSSGTPLSPELDTPLDDTISAAVNTPLSEGLKDTLTPQAAKATAVNSPVKKTLSISTSITAKAKGGKASPVATKTAGTSPGKVNIQDVLIRHLTDWLATHELIPLCGFFPHISQLLLCREASQEGGRQRPPLL